MLAGPGARRAFPGSRLRRRSTPPGRWCAACPAAPCQQRFVEPRQVRVGVGRRGRVVERTEAAQVPVPRLVGRAARSAFDVQSVAGQAAPGRDRPELVSRDVDVLRLRALGAHALRRRLPERLAAACIGGGDRRGFDVERAQRAVDELEVGGKGAADRHQALDAIGAFLTGSGVGGRGSGAARRRPWGALQCRVEGLQLAAPTDRQTWSASWTFLPVRPETRNPNMPECLRCTASRQCATARNP